MLIVKYIYYVILYNITHNPRITSIFYFSIYQKTTDGTKGICVRFQAALQLACSPKIS